MCVESIGWGTTGTNVDDGVHRCWVPGWVEMRRKTNRDLRVTQLAPLFALAFTLLDYDVGQTPATSNRDGPSTR